MEKKKYFKALCNYGDNYYSAVVEGEYCVQYQPNQWTKAKKGKLFVFSSRRQANKFLTSGFGDCVLPCEVKNPVEPRGKKSWLCKSCAFFWNKFAKNGSLPLMKNYWPPGTLWADAVKILPEKKRRL